MVNIKDAIAATFDDLDFVVEALDKTTIEPFDKIVGNVIKVRGYFYIEGDGNQFFSALYILNIVDFGN